MSRSQIRSIIQRYTNYRYVNESFITEIKDAYLKETFAITSCITLASCFVVSIGHMSLSNDQHARYKDLQSRYDDIKRQYHSTKRANDDLQREKEMWRTQYYSVRDMKRDIEHRVSYFEKCDMKE